MGHSWGVKRAPRAPCTLMELAELVLGYLTGLHFVGSHPLDLPTLLATGVVINTCDAIMCRLFARNNGYPVRLWTILGFVFGVWAVGLFILLPKREAPPA